jgi:hypothetical protein
MFATFIEHLCGRASRHNQCRISILASCTPWIIQPVGYFEELFISFYLFFYVLFLRFRQWGEGARLAGGRSGETRGIERWSGGVLRRVAAVS